MIKAARVGIGVLLAALLTLVSGAARLPAAPDFFLLPVADAAGGGALLAGMLTGLFAGLAEDLLTAPGRLLGLHAFTKVLLGYGLASLGARTVVEKPATVGALVGGAVAAEAALLVMLLWILKAELLPPAWPQLAARMATTGLAGAVYQAALRYPWRARLAARRRRRIW